jgi:hypothetical protein
MEHKVLDGLVLKFIIWALGFFFFCVFISWMLLSDIIFISQLPLFTQLQTFSLCVGLFLEKCYILSQDLLLYSSQVW